MFQMHCSSLEGDGDRREGGDVLVAIAAMVTEGRIPGKFNQTKTRGFYEGPHCPIGKTAQEHRCDSNDNLVNESTSLLVSHRSVYALCNNKGNSGFTFLIKKKKMLC